MWSQPDIATGLVSPPPYTDVIGEPAEENRDSLSYPIENDPNRQLTARDSRRGRERRNTHIQGNGDTDRPPGGQRPPGQQPGDLHIVLRRNSNTASSGTNSLEHNQSVGNQPLRVPVEAVYGNTLQQRNKQKDTASPQISVTNEGHKDTPHQSSTSLQTSVDRTEIGAAVEPVGEQARRSASAEAADSIQASPTSQTQTTGRHRGHKANRKRGRHRNPGPPTHHEEPNHARRSNPKPSHHATAILYPEPETTVSLRQTHGASMMPRLLRQSYSQADIPTSVEWSGPPDPRRASSAGRLVPDEGRSSGGPQREGERRERPQLSPVPQEDIEPQSLGPSHNSATRPNHSEVSEVRAGDGSPDGYMSRATNREGLENSVRGSNEEREEEEEEEYRKRLSQSSQHLRLLLRRSASEEEDMFV